MANELLQHIRTVHLLLLALCLIVWASAPDAAKINLGPAFEEAEEIQRLVSDPDVIYAKGSKIDDFLDGGVLEGRDSTSATNVLSAISQPWNLLVRSASENLVDGSALPSPWLICEWGGCENPKKFPNRFTIEEFRWFWNRGFLMIPDPSIANRRVEHQTKGDVPTQWRQSMPSQLVCSLRANPIGALGDRFALSEITLTCTSGPDKATWVTQFNPPFYPVLATPISEIFDPSSDQIRAWHEIPINSVYGGMERFSHTFPDLPAVLQVMPNQPISDLLTSLKARVDAEPERIDVLGAKVPVSTVVPLLGVLLLAFEFYLWTTLKELARILPSEDDKPWPSGFIGLYSDRLSIWVFALTLTALPVASVAIALRRSFTLRSWRELGWPEVACVSTTLLGACFGFFSTILTQRIRASRRTSRIPITTTDSLASNQELSQECKGPSGEKLTPMDRK